MTLAFGFVLELGHFDTTESGHALKHPQSRHGTARLIAVIAAFWGSTAAR